MDRGNINQLPAVQSCTKSARNLSHTRMDTFSKLKSRPCCSGVTQRPHAMEGAPAQTDDHALVPRGGCSSGDTTPSAPVMTSNKVAAPILLVVECSPQLNWAHTFRDASDLVEVVQATWPDIALTTYNSSECVVEVRASATGCARTVRPAFVLMRSVTRSIGTLDSRNLLFGLHAANIPIVNSFESLYFCLERPLVHAELSRLQRQLGGFDAFPLIKQTFYPSHRQMVISPDFPCIVKIGPCHSGFGKVLVRDRTAWDDLRSGEWLWNSPTSSACCGRSAQ